MIPRISEQLRLLVRASPFRLPPRLATHKSGGPNLEIFKFGMYVMFPIGWMWYFGTNLEARFAVPDFWPKPGETHKLPFEREDIKEFSEQLKAMRLEKRRKRLEQEQEQEQMEVGEGGVIEARQNERVEETETTRQDSLPDKSLGAGAIERWARGK